MPYDDLYEKHGNRTGIDPAFLKRVAQIENSERADGCTGSYCGIMQLSQREFTANGGTGSRFDPEQSISAAANNFAKMKVRFQNDFGREPTSGEMYMMHQQGEAGLRAHMQNPDAPAWQNMYSTGEGKEKGAGWAKLAIRLNTPGGVGQYGGVENISSQQFLSSWNSKFGPVAESHEPAGLPRQAEELPDEHEPSGLPSGAVSTGDDEGKPQRAGRGQADAKKASLVNEIEDEDIQIPKPPPFKVPDLVPKFI